VEAYCRVAIDGEPVGRVTVLLADIGGTYSRFALLSAHGQPERMRVVENDAVADLGAAIAVYLDETDARPRAGVFAVAAPVDSSDEIALTNRAWLIRRSALAQRFGLSEVRVVNDFEAIAWALLRLGPDDVRALGPPLPPRDGVKLVLGPGTGLGVAALVPAGGGALVLASEGGHSDFGPQAPSEYELFARLASDWGHVSAETLLSGPGLARLHHAINPRARPDTPESPESIVANATAGEPTARATVATFVRLLGRFAGAMALTFRATGGVYIAGGVTARFGPLFDARSFRMSFEAHPPYLALLEGTSTHLISRAEPGLLGCAVLADKLAGA
jgi:glucokinase